MTIAILTEISSAPEEEQITSLEDTLDSLDIYEELTQLIRIWRSGNTDALAQMRQMDQKSSDQLAMTNQIEEFLNTHDGETYFVVVGTLHLGENSIVDLLEKRGFSVEPHTEFNTN